MPHTACSMMRCKGKPSLYPQWGHSTSRLHSLDAAETDPSLPLLNKASKSNDGASEPMKPLRPRRAGLARLAAALGPKTVAKSGAGVAEAGSTSGTAAVGRESSTDKSMRKAYVCQEGSLTQLGTCKIVAPDTAKSMH